MEDVSNECFNDMNVDHLYEELYILRERVFALETENTELKHSLSNVKELKAQLEMSLVNNTVGNEQSLKAVPKPQKSKKNRTPSEIQMMNFYRRNKDNPCIVSKLKTSLESIGFTTLPLPWQLVKSECDKLFMTLDESEKQKY